MISNLREKAERIKQISSLISKDVEAFADFPSASSASGIQKIVGKNNEKPQEASKSSISVSSFKGELQKALIPSKKESFESRFANEIEANSPIARNPEDFMENVERLESIGKNPSEFSGLASPGTSKSGNRIRLSRMDVDEAEELFYQR